MDRSLPLVRFLPLVVLTAVCSIASTLVSGTAHAQDQCAAQHSPLDGWRQMYGTNISINADAYSSSARMLEDAARFSIRSTTMPPTGWQQLNLTLDSVQ